MKARHGLVLRRHRLLRWPAGRGGSCADGLIAVNRAYNNGFLRNDSNHRFTTSDSNWPRHGARRMGAGRHGDVRGALSAAKHDLGQWREPGQRL